MSESGIEHAATASTRGGPGGTKSVEIANTLGNTDAPNNASTENTGGDTGENGSGATGDTRVDPTTIPCHRKGCKSLGFKYPHNSCTGAHQYKNNWAFCESCYIENQEKSRASTKKNQRKNSMKKSLLKGAPLLKETGVKLVVPNNAPADVKKLVEDMGMEMSARASSGSTLNASRRASAFNNVMENAQLADAVLDDVSINYNQVYGGTFSTEFTYQVICAGIQLYHKGYKDLDFVTSPQQMVRKNSNLGKYVAWHDDNSGNSWKKWLHKLMGGTSRLPNINTTVMESLIDTLLDWYVKPEHQSEYFVKFGILRTEKAGRQVSK